MTTDVAALQMLTVEEEAVASGCNLVTEMLCTFWSHPTA